jgi:hypothetical protein
MSSHLELRVPVGRPWLQATLVKIVPDGGGVDQALLAGRLRECLLGYVPVSLIAGPAVAGSSSVVLDLTPDTGWHRVQTIVATVVEDVLGIGAARIGTAELAAHHARLWHRRSRFRRAPESTAPRHRPARPSDHGPSGLGGRHSGLDRVQVPMDAHFQCSICRMGGLDR